MLDDIEAALAEWEVAGNDILMEPIVLGETAYAFVHGPDGTRLEFVEHFE